MLDMILGGIKKINRVLGYISGALIVASAFVMLYDAMLRYIFNMPSLRAPFIAAYLMLGAIFAGTSHALDYGGHVNVDLLINKFRPVPRKICLSLGYLFSLVFVFYFARACFNFTISAHRDNWRAMGHLPMPMVYLYGIMTFGSAMLLISLLAKLVELWYKKEGVS